MHKTWLFRLVYNYPRFLTADILVAMLLYTQIRAVLSCARIWSTFHAGLATLHALLRYLDYQVCKIIYRFLIIAITFWKYFRAYNLNHFIYEMGNF
jgi:hypothetical protein